MMEIVLMRLMLVAIAVLAMVCTSKATVQTFPEGRSWLGTRTELHADGRRLTVKDAKGGTLGFFIAEPGGMSLRGLVVSNAGDQLVIDAKALFKEGATKLVFRGCNLDANALGGRSATILGEVEAPRGSEFDFLFEGYGQGHYYRTKKLKGMARRRTYRMMADVEAGLRGLHLRFDVRRPGDGGSVKLGAFTIGTFEEQPIQLAKKYVKGELVFHCPFDGHAVATVGAGRREPLAVENVEFVPGRLGQAAKFSAKAKSLLKYAIRDNMDPVRGTVMMWVKRDWDFSLEKQPWRSLFAYPQPGGHWKNRHGCGALWLWWLGSTLRADQSDPDDLYTTREVPCDDRWLHVAFTWDEEGVRVYANGRGGGSKGDGYSPMQHALSQSEMIEVDRSGFTEFFVGGREGRENFDGLIDDLRIYSAPLAPEEIKAIWAEGADPAESMPEKPNYAELFKDWKGSAYSLAPLDRAGIPGRMTLVEEMKLDKCPPEDRFRCVGSYSFKELGGVRYLEADGKSGSRFAIRFTIDVKRPIHCFEIDYPDDTNRTADIIIQPTRGSDYIMQCGVLAGDEYPNTGKILTHRCLYWSHAPEVALVVMTARDGSPAAVSAVRHYIVDADGLPAAKINEPAANKDGWRRTFALYFEDPAIGYDFGLPNELNATPEGYGKLIDRAIAAMKYTGQNLFAYPGAWYQGLINDDYMPRRHAPDFLSAWYEKFDRIGLGVVPTVNLNNMPVKPGLVTRETMSDGSLHPTPIAIHDTGKPNWGKWHDTPPNFNFGHAEVRKHIESIVDVLLAQGRDHPSFKGICMHMTRHCLLWFGDEESGYNDYCIEEFVGSLGDWNVEKLKGLKEVDRNDPLRGKVYAATLRADPVLWEKWLKWRCDRMTEFYAGIAAKLRTARPDLKLWLNSFVPANYNHPDFLRPDFMQRANIACGLDGPALTKAAPNLILCQTMVPADYRHIWRGAYKLPGAYEHQRILDELPGFYDLLNGADYPWVNQHDRYWESAIGRGAKGAKNTLSCEWMDECPWRVSTLNPAGRHALKHFVEPFRYHDVLGMSKGGFLIGTYGMEDELVPFIQAFRALPAVVMKDVEKLGGCEVGTLRAQGVVVRECEFDGRSYFYIANTVYAPRTVTIAFPAGTVDLVTGRSLAADRCGRPVEFVLKPYEFRSFSSR